MTKITAMLMASFISVLAPVAASAHGHGGGHCGGFHGGGYHGGGHHGGGHVSYGGFHTGYGCHGVSHYSAPHFSAAHYSGFSPIGSHHYYNSNWSNVSFAHFHHHHVINTPPLGTSVVTPATMTNSVGTVNPVSSSAGAMCSAPALTSLVSPGIHHRHHFHFGSLFGWHHHGYNNYPNNYSNSTSMPIGTTNGVMQPGGVVTQPTIPIDPNELQQSDPAIIPGVLPPVPGRLYGSR